MIESQFATERALTLKLAGEPRVPFSSPAAVRPAPLARRLPASGLEWVKSGKGARSALAVLAAMSITAKGVGAWVGPVLVYCSSTYLKFISFSFTPSAKWRLAERFSSLTTSSVCSLLLRKKFSLSLAELEPLRSSRSLSPGQQSSACRIRREGPAKISASKASSS